MAEIILWIVVIAFWIIMIFALEKLIKRVKILEDTLKKVVQKQAKKE